MVKDIGRFMTAVGWWWLVVLGTSLFGLLWNLSQTSTWEALLSAHFWAWPALSTPVACFFAWRDEHKRRLVAEDKAIKDIPDFTGDVNRMAFEDPVDGVCVAYYLISVANIGGRASALNKWRAYVQRPGGLQQEVRCDQPNYGEECHLITDASRNEVVIGSDEFISVKAYPTAIEPGHGCSGFLRVYLPEGLPDGTRFQVTFRDVKNRLYECEYDTSTQRKRSDDVIDLGSWPGVKILHGRASV